MTVSISKQQLNDAVKQLARIDRPAAVAVLDRFGVLTTAELLPDAWPAVLAACEDARAKIAGTS